LFKRLAVLLSLIFTLTLTTSAVAQTPTAEDPVEALNAIASDVTISGRSYQTSMVGTPEAGAEMPVMAIVQAYQLDDATVADEAFPYVEQLMKAELEPLINSELETRTVDDLGDAATLSTAEIDQNGTTAFIALLIVQQDEMIFLSASVTMNTPAEDVATDFMTFMLEGKAGDVDAVEFKEDGTSTGGFFDIFPTEKDTDLLNGLEITTDMYETTD
jgi:hypothetical protein